MTSPLRSCAVPPAAAAVVAEAANVGCPFGAVADVRRVVVVVVVVVLVVVVDVVVVGIAAVAH